MSRTITSKLADSPRLMPAWLGASATVSRASTSSLSSSSMSTVKLRFVAWLGRMTKLGGSPSKMLPVADTCRFTLRSVPKAPLAARVKTTSADSSISVAKVAMERLCWSLSTMVMVSDEAVPLITASAPLALDMEKTKVSAGSCRLSSLTSSVSRALDSPAAKVKVPETPV